LRSADAFVLLVGNVLHLEHFLFKFGLRSSIGKALGSILVLELATIQMGSLEEYLFDIGRALTVESLENSFSQIGVIYQLSCILLK
jgi:hypothetical protein